MQQEIQNFVPVISHMLCQCVYVAIVLYASMYSYMRTAEKQYFYKTQKQQNPHSPPAVLNKGCKL